jgi:hypothetical protein
VVSAENSPSTYIQNIHSLADEPKEKKEKVIAIDLDAELPVVAVTSSEASKELKEETPSKPVPLVAPLAVDTQAVPLMAVPVTPATVETKAKKAEKAEKPEKEKPEKSTGKKGKAVEVKPVQSKGILHFFGKAPPAVAVVSAEKKVEEIIE